MKIRLPFKCLCYIKKRFLYYRYRPSQPPYATPKIIDTYSYIRFYREKKKCKFYYKYLALYTLNMSNLNFQKEYVNVEII